MELISFAALAAVAFVAAAVHGATGFGFAVLALPFFLAIMGSLAAVQVTAVINFVISLVLLRQILADAPRRLLLHLVAGSVAGFPLGLAAYRAAELESVKLAVGAVITAFALVLLIREGRLRRSDSPAAEDGGGAFSARPVPETAIGVVSGAMSVALAMPGPVVVLYLIARQAGKSVTRAATLLLFGFSYAAVALIHTLWGGMTGTSWLLAGALSIPVAAGAVSGQYLTRYLSEARFRAIVLGTLVVAGIYGMWTAL